MLKFGSKQVSHLPKFQFLAGPYPNSRRTPQGSDSGCLLQCFQTPFLLITRLTTSN